MGKASGFFWSKSSRLHIEVISLAVRFSYPSFVSGGCASHQFMGVGGRIEEEEGKDSNTKAGEREREKCEIC